MSKFVWVGDEHDITTLRVGILFLARSHRFGVSWSRSGYPIATAARCGAPAAIPKGDDANAAPL